MTEAESMYVFGSSAYWLNINCINALLKISWANRVIFNINTEQPPSSHQPEISLKTEVT